MLEEYYRKNFDRLVRKLSKQMKWENAEDVVQDAFVAALEYPFPIKNMHVFMSVVIKNQKLWGLRNQSRQALEDDVMHHVNDIITYITPEVSAMMKEAESSVLNRIEDLPEPDRSVMMMIGQGDSQRDAAFDLDISQSTVSRVAQNFSKKYNFYFC